MATKRIRAAALLAVLLLCSLCVSGCGDRAELPDKAFVMGVGIDDAGDGEVLVTFQVYKPSQSVAAKGKPGKPYINIRTKGKSVMEAVRDITIHLGRKAQFSHMRVILISERLARRIPITLLLDMFYRDNEPRLTSTVMITKGRATDYFDKVPFIENTISQQYYLSEKSEQYYSGKTVGTTLLTLALQLRSESAIGAVPYLALSGKDTGTEPGVSGLMLVQNGIVTTKYSGQQTEGLLRLLGHDNNGIVEIPCRAGKPREDEENGDEGSNMTDAGGDQNTAAKRLNESAELLRFSSTRTLELSGGEVKAHFRVHAAVATLELSCTKLDTEAQETAFADKISAELKRQLQQSMKQLQQKKADLLGIGNDIYKHHPRLWKKWKPDWPDKFAAMDADFEVDTVILTHGTTAGRSLLATHPE
ncbi:Ger(x)C family spore germination protein [Paenibacillus sacheonensis]|uniref:Ger(X)C family spore germination protein n=1 Tax=Paenibacillus sacheonensis TaxID=742054 RepID=A0A7X4YVQ9_9BACL|nr:Ger(x)C family spore germination C-terminal domain-containing protein [Paenibacillus sacheonensis]MBM7564337.1 spore germination protein KC [Paenibacillus sacheonensis]NBC73433.1 hypothetical protein [Paenibacillus sacheonensis]